MDSLYYFNLHYLNSLVAQMVKNLPGMQETQIRSLGRKILRRREWQLTPVFLPGESHGQRSLAGCSLGGRRVGQDWLPPTFTSASLSIGLKKHLSGALGSVEQNWMGDQKSFGMRHPWVWIADSATTTCVNLGKVFNYRTAVGMIKIRKGMLPKLEVGGCFL